MVDRRPYPGTPRWMKVSGIILFVLVVLIAVLHLSGHGMGHHMVHSGGSAQRP